MMKLFTILLISFLNSTRSGSDSLLLKFNVYKGDKLVGSMICKKMDNNGVTEYINETRMNLNLLMDIAVHNKVHAVYCDGMLQKGGFYRKINSGVRADDHFEWVKDRYIVQSNGKQTELKTQIQHSLCQLMFAEPLSVDKAFSENFKQFVPLKKLEAGKYKLLFPDGKQNFYTYKNGRCVEVTIETGFGLIHIRPMNH